MYNENFRILRPFFKGFPLVIIAIILSVLAAKKYVSYLTPVYESTAKLKLADNEIKVNSTNLINNLDVLNSESSLNTETEVIKSTSVLEKTLSELPFSTEIYRKGDLHSEELFGNSPINVQHTFSNNKNEDRRFLLEIKSLREFVLTTPQNKTLKGNFGVPVTISGGKIIISLNEDFIKKNPNIKIIDRYEIEFLSRQNLLLKTRKNLDIVPVGKDTPIIRINYKSNVPEKAALFVNTLSQVYIQDCIENNYRAADITVDFLNKEIEEAKGKLTDSESKIQNYRDRYDIINIPQETETDLRRVAQLKIQQSNIRMNLDAVKSINSYIKKGKNFLELAPNFQSYNDLLSTEMIKSMKQLQSEKKELLITYTPEHEKVKVIDAKLKDLTDYQRESINNSEKDMQVKYNDITRDINVAERAFVGLPQKERILNVLNREFNLYEKNYNFLNEKRIEAEIAKSAKITFHKVITPGEISKTPVSPNRKIIMIVAAILGMLGSIALIYLYHFAFAKVDSVHSIEKNTNIPVAFTTPFDKEHVQENIRQNILEMELKGIVSEKNVVAITSYQDTKDHRFHVKNILACLEKQNKNVLLIDVAGNMEEFSPKNRLDFSPEKIKNKSKTELEEWVEQEMQGYDFGIVNNIPAKKGAFSMLFMSLADHNLMVLDAAKTPTKILNAIEFLRNEFALEDFWFVLNKTNYSNGFFKKMFSKLIAH